MNQNLQDFARNFATPKGLYQLKTVNHSVLLLPTAFLQGLGIHVYKRESFALARERWPEAGWDIVDTATWIRDNWKFRPSPATRMLSHLPNPEAIGIWHRLFRNTIPGRFFPAINGFGHEAAGLANRLLHYVIEYNTLTD